MARAAPADHAALHDDVGELANPVEAFFSVMTRQAMHRGTFTSVPDLIRAIEALIDAYNQRCQPFVWTKTADDILDHCKPPKT